MLVPVERLLSPALQRPVSGVVHIHIDETIALFHFSRACRDKIDAAPERIAHQVYAVLYRQKTSIA